MQTLSSLVLLLLVMSKLGIHAGGSNLHNPPLPWCPKGPVYVLRVLKQGRKRKRKEEREAEGREGTRESGREGASLMGVWNSAWREQVSSLNTALLLCSLTC